MAIIKVTPELQTVFREIYKNISNNPVAKYFHNINNTEFNEDVLWDEYILDISIDESTIKVTKIPSEINIQKSETYMRIMFDVISSKKVIREQLYRTEDYRISRVLTLFGEIPTQSNLTVFISNYRATYVDLISKTFDFRIVSGEEIRYWYHKDRYYKGRGSLNNSCMRFETHRLDIYVLNPDKIKMLILVNKYNMLIGRCLLWKLDYPYGKIYADRIYTVLEEHTVLFENYIFQKNWWNKDTHNNKSKIVALNHSSSQDLPYLDSFSCYKKGKNSKSITILHKNVSYINLRFILEFMRIKRKLNIES
jgi:hypothetical protein